MAPIQPMALRLTLNAFIPYDHIDDPHPYMGTDRILEGDGSGRTWDENGSSRVSQIMDVWNQSLGPGPVFLSERRGRGLHRGLSLFFGARLSDVCAAL
jgi:hypothetical protein